MIRTADRRDLTTIADMHRQTVELDTHLAAACSAALRRAAADALQALLVEEQRYSWGDATDDDVEHARFVYRETTDSYLNCLKVIHGRPGDAGVRR